MFLGAKLKMELGDRHKKKMKSKANIINQTEIYRNDNNNNIDIVETTMTKTSPWLMN